MMTISDISDCDHNESIPITSYNNLAIKLCELFSSKQDQ